MGKSSSSSLKKKRSKKSSKVRSKKISKSSARKSNSKKFHRKDSICDSSDDDSRSLFSVSSYSSEDENRSRRARSRTRKHVKSGKKRARKRSSSRDSSEDSQRVTKKKGVKKIGGSRGRKRTHEKKKKKARRDASVGSISSGSRCGSGCRFGHGSSGESEYESKKESDETNVDKIQTERYRSMDHPALYDQCTESIDHWIQEKGTGENNNNPRRLRSVIILIKQEDEGTESDNKEQPKEEIVCDHDDYPSSRSNDSNDGGNKEESDNNTSFDSEKKVKAEVEKEGAAASNNNNPGNEAQDATRDPGEEDLESVLRRRALENLTKFRGKGPGDNKAGKQTISAEVEPFQNKPVEENDARGMNTAEIVEKISMPPSKRDTARSLRIDEKSLHQNDGCSQSVTDNLQKKVNPPDDSVTDKPKLVAAALRRQNSTKPQITPKQASASQKTRETPVSSEDKISAGDAQAMTRPIIEGGEGVNPNAHGSTTTEPPSLKSPAEATISEEPQDGAKETSQYEQKTMSVMRGGQMVQVSYKVYIPKKIPALARRQLKR